MEWRCEWCGKPHETDDPPCDNCGHGSFERAVVKQPDAGSTDGSTTLWVCPACGREHTKHSPPCSRCGNANLERQEYTVDDDELAVPSYLDLLTPKYVLGFVAVFLLVGILVGGYLGYVDVPGLSGESPDVPDPSTLPGDNETYDGTSLAAVETAYLDRMNEFRAGVGAPNRTRTDRLDGAATDVNLLFVDARLGDGDVPTSSQLSAVLGSACTDDDPILVFHADVENGTDSATSLGRSLAEQRIAEHGVGGADGTGSVGLDVYAAGETLYVTELPC